MRICGPPLTRTLSSSGKRKRDARSTQKSYGRSSEMHTKRGVAPPTKRRTASREKPYRRPNPLPDGGHFWLGGQRCQFLG